MGQYSSPTDMGRKEAAKIINEGVEGQIEGF